MTFAFHGECGTGNYYEPFNDKTASLWKDCPEVAQRPLRRGRSKQDLADILTEGRYPERIPLDELLAGIEG